MIRGLHFDLPAGDVGVQINEALDRRIWQQEPAAHP
jgi:hypothetical protein